MKTSFIQQYKEVAVPALASELGISNPLAIPKITKVVVNVGLKEAVTDKGVVEKVANQLKDITGQKPRINRAKKSIANFKLRQGDVVGVSVTMRGKKMEDFLMKLLTVVLPRVRDFHGVSNKAFDRSGNYSLGLSEQIVFPEIEYAKIDKIRGLQITLSTTAKDAKISRRLLELVGMPFEK
jgi:large subunit ribosomal protein L5